MSAEGKASGSIITYVSGLYYMYKIHGNSRSQGHNKVIHSHQIVEKAQLDGLRDRTHEVL